MKNLNKLVAVAGVGALACVGMISVFGKKVSKQIIDSSVCQKVVEEVEKHKGALHFLGEPLEIKAGKFDNLGFQFRDHSDIKILVQGPKSPGVVYCTLIKKEPEEFLVDSIQLQIGADDTKRLVIRKSARNDETKLKAM